jgi:hypothetical protein
MSAVEPIFPCVPVQPEAPETPRAEATQVIETVGVEVLENTPDAIPNDLKKTAHANDVIPFASTLPRVG